MREYYIMYQSDIFPRELSVENCLKTQLCDTWTHPDPEKQYLDPNLARILVNFYWKPLKNEVGESDFFDTQARPKYEKPDPKPDFCDPTTTS